MNHERDKASIAELVRRMEAALRRKTVRPELFCRIFSEIKGRASILKMLGGVRNIERLISKEIVVDWPEEYIEDLVTLLLNSSYCPDKDTWPCGRREMLVAEVLSDRGLSKSIRAKFWRGFIMDGVRIPGFRSGECWTVPNELLDHVFAREWYCACEKPGTNIVSCSHPLFFTTGGFCTEVKNEMLRKSFSAIWEDSPSRLMLPLGIMGIDLPEAFFMEALRVQAVKIITWALSNDSVTQSRITFDQLLFYVCSNWDADKAISIVRHLEEIVPGIVAHARDVLNRTPLWYTFFHVDSFGKTLSMMRNASNPLARVLIRLGCDPELENDLGLSYYDVVDC